jgi:mono/diheme cytochrome c family protein
MAPVAVALACGACDESASLHPPDFSLGRMIEQPRADPYDPSPVFSDGLAMRRPPRGTIPHGVRPVEQPPVTRELVERGRERFETFCAACHGVLGDGRSVVATKMELRKPPSLHEPRILALQPQALVAVIDDGYGLMPSYADALSPEDRWAVAQYVKALQLARGVNVADLPPELRSELQSELATGTP